jgi:hypothetical protein
LFVRINEAAKLRFLCEIGCFIAKFPVFSIRFVFFVILQPQNRGKGMKNLCNILNINKLSKNSEGGGVNLLSEFSHTLSPRQAGMDCLGFFYPPLQMGQGIQQTPAGKYGIASQEIVQESIKNRSIIFESLNLKSLNTKSLNLN